MQIKIESWGNEDSNHTPELLQCLHIAAAALATIHFCESKE
jgi:hypothetical protein